MDHEDYLRELNSQLVHLEKEGLISGLLISLRGDGRFQDLADRLRSFLQDAERSLGRLLLLRRTEGTDYAQISVVAGEIDQQADRIGFLKLKSACDRLCTECSSPNIDEFKFTSFFLGPAKEFNATRDRLEIVLQLVQGVLRTPGRNR